ncbi:hypothetical protein Jann_2074 [Jannaschia sp. CCS1]|nr:hypothetical protein Jann_2074 [Jannaschia sp. CCS1]
MTGRRPRFGGVFRCVADRDACLPRWCKPCAAVSDAGISAGMRCHFFSGSATTRHLAVTKRAYDMSGTRGIAAGYFDCVESIPM